MLYELFLYIEMTKEFLIINLIIIYNYGKLIKYDQKMINLNIYKIFLILKKTSS